MRRSPLTALPLVPALVLALGLTLGAGPAQAATTATVTATPSSTTPSAGGTLAVSGKVSAQGVKASALKGRKVTLQRQSGSSWKAVVSSTLSSTGTYRLATKAVLGGATYRTYVPASGPVRASASRAFTVTGYRWRLLADLPQLSGSDFDPVQTVELGGIEHAHSLRASIDNQPESGEADTEDRVRFGLNGRCRSLRAEYGPTMDSDGSARIVVLGDGREKFSRDLEPGESVVSQLGLGGVRTLEIVGSAADGDATYPALATPEVQCSF